MIESKFNTQVCTTREQSEWLLALGLKKETADCHLLYGNWKCDARIGKKDEWNTDPAWSLDRLIAMIPDRIYADGNLWNLSIQSLQVEYSRVDSETIGYKKSLKCFGYYKDSLYDSVVQCIEWLIKNKHFNEEYLEETK